MRKTDIQEVLNAFILGAVALPTLFKGAMKLFPLIDPRIEINVPVLGRWEFTGTSFWIIFSLEGGCIGAIISFSRIMVGKRAQVKLVGNDAPCTKL